MTLHRANASQDWREVSIVCALPYGRFLVEEMDTALPGRFVAMRLELREVVGTLEPEECLSGRVSRSDEHHTGAAR
jgi:hypothetical protein